MEDQTDPQNSNPTLFSGCCFAFNSHSNFKTPDNKLLYLIESNGGTFSRNPNKEITHLICSSINKSFRIEMAQKHGAHLVNENFILDSIKANKIMNVENYLIKPPETDKKDEEKEEFEGKSQEAFKVFLKTGTKRVQINEATTILGRGELLGIENKKCSRNQAELNIDFSKKEVFIIQRGTNPSILLTPQFQIMEKDEPYKLNNGDKFMLCADDIAIEVEVVEESTIKSKPQSPITQSKKQRIVVDYYEKINGKPVCKYGTQCHRLNSSHKQRYIHQSPSINLKANDGKFSLAFPSISTSTFEFDLNKAAHVACERISEFLKLHPNPEIRLILVDVTNSETLQVFRKHYTLGDPRFIITDANITQLKTKNIPCRFICNTTNESFSPHGSGVNKAINDAAGPSLYENTLKYYQNAECGHAYLVELPPSSPLRKEQGVEYVIHVLGPNMNPKNPNCLNSDYKQGCRLLEQAYSSLLQTFYQATGLDKEECSESLVKPDEEIEFDIDQEIKQFKSQNSKAKNEQENKSKKDEGTSGSWAEALKPYIHHPEKYPTQVYQYDEQTVTIYDKYPKAKYHFLVIPRTIINSFSKLEESHMSLLQTIYDKGKEVANSIVATNPDVKFRFGFHAVPSLNQLHMHVISEDFQSDSLKNKKHWNSFTTKFFLSPERFMSKLSKNGYILFDKAKYLSFLQEPLRCHRCHTEFPTIPKLKTHLLACVI